MAAKLFIFALACAGGLGAQGSFLKRAALRTASSVGETLGEGAAATQYFGTVLGALPRNVSQEKAEKIIESLSGEVEKLSDSAKRLKDSEKALRANTTAQENFRANLSAKDQKMMERMDGWNQRMTEKAQVGATNVISKLRNVIHLIKKGALSGNNTKAESQLSKVLEDMTRMSR